MPGVPSANPGVKRTFKMFQPADELVIKENSCTVHISDEFSCFSVFMSPLLQNHTTKHFYLIAVVPFHGKYYHQFCDVNFYSKLQLMQST